VCSHIHHKLLICEAGVGETCVGNAVLGCLPPPGLADEHIWRSSVGNGLMHPSDTHSSAESTWTRDLWALRAELCLSACFRCGFGRGNAVFLSGRPFCSPGPPAMDLSLHCGNPGGHRRVSEGNGPNMTKCSCFNGGRPGVGTRNCSKVWPTDG